MHQRTLSLLTAVLLVCACGSGSPPNLLAPCTADKDCTGGGICCATAGNVCVMPSTCAPAACKRPVVTSALPSAQVVSLGKHTVGDLVSFDVPAGTSSFTVVHQAYIAGLNITYKGQVLDNSAVPGQIIKPDGTRAYDDNDLAFQPTPSSDGGTDPSGLYSFYGGGTPSTAAFTVPNTATSLDAGVPTGTWKAVVNDYAYECTVTTGCTDGGTNTGSYDVSVILRPSTAGSNLDVAFYLVADLAPPLTAANAATDPSVQRMVSTFKSIYTGAGITVRTVSYYDVSAADRARFGARLNADKGGPCDDLDQMFTLSSAHPGNTLNLFLVQSIVSVDSGGGSVVGVDGTIPGPATLSGTVHSGAAVSLGDLFSGLCGGAVDLLSCGADRVAYIAAHEAGHFLGMFHTTESGGRDFDPITDTLKCPCLPCSGRTTAECDKGMTTGSTTPNIFLSASQCVGVGTGCGGGDNLMFWQFDRSYSVGKISPQQGALMRLSPAVQ